MATKQAKIHFLATKGPLPTAGQPVPGSNAIIIQDYDEDNDKYVYGMIDVGYWKNPGVDEDAARVLYDKTLITNYLKKHSITELEFILITHYHVDHFRGLKYLLNPGTNDPKINIKNLILPMNEDRIAAISNKLEPGDISDATNALAAIKKWHGIYKTTHPGSKILYFGVSSNTAIKKVCNIGMGSFTFYNTNPLTSQYETIPSPIPSDKYNWYLDKFSIVTFYQVDGKKILFPADIYALSERIMLQRETLVDCDVVQISHHGSSRASCTEFVDYVIPDNKPCAAIQLRSGVPVNPRALTEYKNKNTDERLVRVYGVSQKFADAEIWGTNCSDAEVASIVLEIRDGNIRYCSRRFVNTTKGYAQKTIPANVKYNI